MASATPAPNEQASFHTAVDQFLEHIFGEDFDRAWVTGFSHDPAASSTDGRVQAIAWGGAPYAQQRRRILPNCNNYLCISTFKVGSDGKARRRSAMHDKTYALMIDDVGEKISVDKITLPPTFKVQTSPNSQQWWYVLAVPITNGARIRATIDNLIAAGLTTDNKDPGMRGVNRYGRLPFGINSKEKYKRPDGAYPEVILAEPPQWGLRPTLDKFAEAFGVDSRPHRQPLEAGAPSHGDALIFNSSLISALESENYYKESKGRGKHEVTCPWAFEHTGKADNGAAVFEAGYKDTATGEVYQLGGFRCHHGHGEEITLRHIVRLLNARGHPVGQIYPAKPKPEDEFDIIPSDSEMLELPGATPVPQQTVVVGHYETTDVANAYRLAEIAAGRLKWHRDKGKWLFFNGERWHVDVNDTGFAMLRSTVGTYIGKLATEARSNNMADEAKLLSQWATTSRMAPRLTAMTNLVKELPGMALNTTEVDRNPLLLGVANGVVNLSTGDLDEPSRAVIVTANTGVRYDADAVAPDWEPFLRGILGHADGTNDDDLYEYFRLYLGYCMTGLRTYEFFTILHGAGVNGKSTLLAVLERVVGDYAKRVRPTMFEQARTPSGAGGATPELAQLPGVRIVTASETSEGSRLNMELIKQMTGDDISARQLYQEEFLFTPAFKTLFSTNHLPIVTSTDDATWRRLHPIPFDRRWRLANDTSGAKWPLADLTLRDRLLAQLPGVQTWLVAAAREFLERGLILPRLPERIAKDQMVYRVENDILGKWIDDRCQRADNVKATGLYSDYRRWCDESGIKPLSAFAWSRRMLERFGEPIKESGQSFYVGICLKLL